MKNRKQTQPEQTPRPPAGRHQPGQHLLLHQPLLLGRNGPAGHGQERILGKFRLAIPEPVPGDDKRQGVKFFPRTGRAGSGISSAAGSIPRPLLHGEGAAHLSAGVEGTPKSIGQARLRGKTSHPRRGGCPHPPGRFGARAVGLYVSTCRPRPSGPGAMWASPPRRFGGFCR